MLIKAIQEMQQLQDSQEVQGNHRQEDWCKEQLMQERTSLQEQQVQAW